MRRLFRVISILLALIVLPRAAHAAPGQLLSATPIAAPRGASAWRILYETSDQAGRVVQSSGVLIVPIAAAPTDGRPVVAWAHGTTGVAEGCAPSKEADPFAGIPALPEMIARNWVVVASDYPGLGTAGPHGYLVGAAEGRAVLDSVRAARNFGRAGAGSKMIVWGLSQGGHAALFTGEEARRYAPELALAGIVAAAPPTDLAANLAETANPTTRTVLTAFAVASWAKVYDAPLRSLLNASGERVLGRLAKVCTSQGIKFRNKLQVLHLRRQLGKLDLSAIDPWKSLLTQNSAGNSPPGGPLFVAQGSADEIVAPAVTQRFVASLCRRGDPVTFVQLPGVAHGDTAKRSATQALAWMTARFAGARAGSTCG